MKSRPNLLQRLWCRIFSRRPRPAVSPKPPAGPRASRRPPGIEPLEGRIAPAALVSPNSISFTDLDGDLVTVTFSKALFDLAKSTAENSLNSIFKFSDGTAPSTFDETGPQQLQLIDITAVPSVLNPGPTSLAAKTDITVIAVPRGTGDGLTNIGAIEANTVSLGHVTIDGDLGQIDVGSGSDDLALKSLTVETLGRFGASTQVANATAADALESRIAGKLNSLTIGSDLYGYVHVVDGGFNKAPGKIGAVKIGGSLIGNAAVDAASNNTGSIQSAGEIKSVTISGRSVSANPAGIVGGGGLRSGAIVATDVGRISIDGAVHGGAGVNSGSIILSGDLGPLSIGQGLMGAAGNGSGSVQVAGKIKSVHVTGDLQGGAGSGSAVISSERTVGSVVIEGDILGGGTNSAGISVGKDLSKLQLKGDLLGATTVSGTVFHTAFIEVLENARSIAIEGDVTGGDVANSAIISVGGTLGGITVQGAMHGGAGANSGSIFAGTDFNLEGDLRSAQILGGMTGGSGLSSGSIIAGGPIKRAVVGSSHVISNLAGGDGIFSGIIWADEGISSVVVNGSVTGGAGENSGAIHAGGILAKASIKGHLAGGSGDLSGAIVTHGEKSDAASITIGAGVDGGAGDGAGGLRIEGGLRNLKVQGPLTGAEVRVANNIGKIMIAGNVSDSLISAAGIPISTDVAGKRAVSASTRAIGSIKVLGSVSGSQVLAGYDLEDFAVNADASIGTVQVSGNWTSSDVVAGVEDVNGDGFGQADDAVIAGDADHPDLISQISRIIVGGQVTGTTGTDDHFGFTAERILSCKVAGTSVALSKSVGGQSFELGLDAATTVREVLPA